MQPLIYTSNQRYHHDGVTYLVITLQGGPLQAGPPHMLAMDEVDHLVIGQRMHPQLNYVLRQLDERLVYVWDAAPRAIPAKLAAFLMDAEAAGWDEQRIMAEAVARGLS